jgi:hypothetical protein
MSTRVELEVGGQTEEMPFEMFVRWACLVEAVDHITQKCNQLGMAPDDDSWIKPNAIEKYIDERFLSMRYNLAAQLE